MTHNIPISLINFNPRFFENKEKHHFHLVENSQLPLITALASMLFVFNGVFYLHILDLVHFKFFDHMGFQIA